MQAYAQDGRAPTSSPPIPSRACPPNPAAKNQGAVPARPVARGNRSTPASDFRPSRQSDPWQDPVKSPFNSRAAHAAARRSWPARWVVRAGLRPAAGWSPSGRLFVKARFIDVWRADFARSFSEHTLLASNAPPLRVGLLPYHPHTHSSAQPSPSCPVKWWRRVCRWCPGADNYQLSELRQQTPPLTAYTHDLHCLYGPLRYLRHGSIVW